MDKKRHQGDHDMWDNSAFLCTTRASRPKNDLEKSGTEGKCGESDSKAKCLELDYSKHSTAVVVVGDGKRVRRRAGKVTVKYGNGVKQFITHAARTIITEDSCRHFQHERMKSMETVKVKGFGRVRTQMIVRTNVADRVALSNGTPEERGGNEYTEVTDLHVDNSGQEHGDSTGSNVNNGPIRRRRKKKIPKETDETEQPAWKRRKRCRISIEQFTMFGKNGVDLDSRSSDRGNSQVVLTDEQKFSKSIKDSQWCMASLQDVWEETPFIRCSGGKRRDQKFICVATVRMKRNLFGGGHSICVLLSLILEDESTKARTLTVRNEKHFYKNGTASDMGFTWIFSCNIRRTGSGTADSDCWHMKCLIEDAGMVSNVVSIIECGYMESNEMYYGETAIINETRQN